MLFPPEETREKLRKAADAARASNDLQDLRRLTEAFPWFGSGWIMLGARTKDPQEAEDALWKGLRLNPCRSSAYLALAEFLTGRNESDAMAKQLRILAIWKFSFADKVPDFVAETFKNDFGSQASEPEMYALLAQAQETQSANVPAIDDKLRLFRLLNDLQRYSSEGLSTATLGDILKHREECEPVFRNALREWASASQALRVSSAALVIAILGEISGPDFADELMEVINWDNQTISLHVQWALYQQAHRYPDVVMELFRKWAAETLPIRCAIVAHILEMQPVEGDVEVLESLLHGYKSFAGEDDAPTLLVGVAGALVARGKSDLANRLAKQFGAELDAFERRQLRQALDGSTFRMLAGEEIPDLTLEDVCAAGLLMEDDDDEEDKKLDDEEFEDPVDLAPPPRPGRNESCWCGSGKKYKKCHLNADEESERKRAAAPREPSVSLHASLSNRVAQAAVEWHKTSDLRRAREMYFGEGGELAPDESQISGFVEWLMHDFRDRVTRQTAIENFLRTRGPKLTPAERELLESLRDASYALYEVERVVPGSGIDVHDLFSGDRMFVHDITSSHAMHRWDCILTRTQYCQGRWIFAGNGLNVPRNILDHVRGFIEDESRRANQSPADYVRANSHNLHRVVREAFADNLKGIRVVNNEGEAVTFGSAEYSVTDEAALIARLESLEELEAGDPDESGKRRFVWLQPIGKERRLLGSLEIESGTLKAEAMSRTRLETLRGLVEFHAGPLVTHRGDHYTSVDEIKDRVIRGEKAPARQPHSEEELAAIQEYLAQHYAGWPDEDLPALGGRTTRQAVQDPAGRQAVIDLLRMMENGEERKRDSGAPAYDFNIIRRDLGLPEE